MITNIKEKFLLQSIWNSEVLYVEGKDESVYCNIGAVISKDLNSDMGKESFFTLSILGPEVQKESSQDHLVVSKESLFNNWNLYDIFKIQKDLTGGSTVLLYNENRTILHVSDNKKLLSFMRNSYKEYLGVTFSFSGDILGIDLISQEELEELNIDF